MRARAMPAIVVPRSLKLFWSGVLGIVIVGVLWLAYLGPIKPPPQLAERPKGGGIPPPSRLLLAAASTNPLWKIPHPGPYGVAPMHYYAAPAPAASGAPRIAIMVAGIGYALAPSLDAVRDLPPQVSLALSPYGAHIQKVATAARIAGHETLMGLPMQVDGEPAITAGDQALRAGSLPAHNRNRLDWALSRAAGYAGVTDAIGLDAPETFLNHQHAAAWLATRLTHEGLFLVIASRTDASNADASSADASSIGASSTDASSIGAQPADPNVTTADTIIDPTQGTAAETASLKQLETIAMTRGSAIGVLVDPTRRAITVLASWCKTLAGQNIVLVPVSALAARTQ